MGNKLLKKNKINNLDHQNLKNDNNQINNIIEYSKKCHKEKIEQYLTNNSIIQTWKKDLPNKECIICFDDFKENDKIRILKCTHMYHKKCIDEWISIKTICPECMDNIF